MRTRLALAATSLLLAGCGAYRIGPGDQPTPAPSPRFVTQVTTEDDGRSVSVHAGSVLDVALIAPSGCGDWQHPVSSDPAVLAPTVNPAAAAVRGTTLAAFRGVRPGMSKLTSYATPVCPPGKACSTIARAWSVSVTVAP